MQQFEFILIIKKLLYFVQETLEHKFIKIISSAELCITIVVILLQDYDYIECFQQIHFEEANTMHIP